MEERKQTVSLRGERRVAEPRIVSYSFGDRIQAANSSHWASNTRSPGTGCRDRWAQGRRVTMRRWRVSSRFAEKYPRPESAGDSAEARDRGPAGGEVPSQASPPWARKVEPGRVRSCYCRQRRRRGIKQPESIKASADPAIQQALSIYAQTVSGRPREQGLIAGVAAILTPKGAHCPLELFQSEFDGRMLGETLNSITNKLDARGIGIGRGLKTAPGWTMKRELFSRQATTHCDKLCDATA